MENLQKAAYQWRWRITGEELRDYAPPNSQWRIKHQLHSSCNLVIRWSSSEQTQSHDTTVKEIGKLNIA
jgi:hypothetical protein